MKTTLYNHKPATDGDKPLIPNIIYRGLLFLAEHGCFEDCDYIEANYSMTEYQKHVYKQCYKKGQIIYS